MRRLRTLAQQRVYEAVSYALQEQGLTHDDVAKMLGKNKQTVSNRICQGSFTPAMAERWSKALDIPVSVFLEGGENPLPESGYEALIRDVVKMQKEIIEIRKEMERIKEAMEGKDHARE